MTRDDDEARSGGARRPSGRREGWSLENTALSTRYVQDASPRRWAVLIGAVVFGVSHGAIGSPKMLIATAIGIVLGVVYVRTRSLWAPWFVDQCVDIVADSLLG